MKILITGTSKGLGKLMAARFLSNGEEVIGLDILESPFKHNSYIHYVCDVSKDKLPEIDNIDVLILNHGTAEEERAVMTNVEGTIRVGEKYAPATSVKHIIVLSSVAAFTGIDMPRYCASKGACYSYMLNLAQRFSPKGKLVNCISPEGVYTDLSTFVTNDPALMKKCFDQTLTGKWCEDVDEITDLAEFLIYKNRSMTGQNLLIDNGESIKDTFICPPDMQAVLDNGSNIN